MNFYKDHLYKKLKPKSDGKIIAFLLFILKNYKIVLNKFVKYLVLENLLETTEQRLAKTNQVSLFNVSIPTQVKTYISRHIVVIFNL